MRWPLAVRVAFAAALLARGAAGAEPPAAECGDGDDACTVGSGSAMLQTRSGKEQSGSVSELEASVVTWESFSDDQCTTKAAHPGWFGMEKFVFSKALGSACITMEYFRFGEPGSGNKYLKLDDNNILFAYNGVGCTGSSFKFPTNWLTDVRCPTTGCTAVGGVYVKESGTGFEPDSDVAPDCSGSVQPPSPPQTLVETASLLGLGLL